MYVVRNVFHCKPGKAKDLVAKLEAASPSLEEEMGVRQRVLTDVAAGFWTVVFESEVEDLSAYLGRARGERGAQADQAMAGYMELVTGGYREIFKVE